jgi:hypothetical protein
MTLEDLHDENLFGMEGVGQGVGNFFSMAFSVFLPIAWLGVHLSSLTKTSM